MNSATPEVTELGEDHRDGTIYGDTHGDIWMPHPWGGWIYSHWGPFGIHSAMAHPSAVYGPYRPVAAPPQRRQEYGGDRPDDD